MECMQLLMFEEMVCTVEHASYVYKSGCDCFILSLTTFLKWYCLAHIYLSCSLSLCLAMKTVWFSGVSMFCHLLLETFEEEGFFGLRWCIMFHSLCEDKTEVFSLVHTNIVVVRYKSLWNRNVWQFAWFYILTICSVHLVQIGDANSQQKIESSSNAADPGYATTEKNSLVSGGKQWVISQPCTLLNWFISPWSISIWYSFLCEFCQDSMRSYWIGFTVYLLDELLVFNDFPCFGVATKIIHIKN